MTVRELVERLVGANADAPVEIVDVSGRGLKLAITDGKWAIQVEDHVVFIRIDDAPSREGA